MIVEINLAANILKLRRFYILSGLVAFLEKSESLATLGQVLYMLVGASDVLLFASPSPTPYFLM